MATFMPNNMRASAFALLHKRVGEFSPDVNVIYKQLLCAKVLSTSIVYWYFVGFFWSKENFGKKADLRMQIPKVQKAAWHDCLFALLGSARVKAAHKMLVKLTLDLFFFIIYLFVCWTKEETAFGFALLLLSSCWEVSNNFTTISPLTSNIKKEK